MNEQVSATIVGRDEAKALVVAEPFDGTRCHLLPFGSYLYVNGSGCRRPPTGRRKRSRDGSLPTGRARGCDRLTDRRTLLCPGPVRGTCEPPREDPRSGTAAPRLRPRCC